MEWLGRGRGVYHLDSHLEFRNREHPEIPLPPERAPVHCMLPPSINVCKSVGFFPDLRDL